MKLSAVESLLDTHSLDQFSCGKPMLDDWLKSYAKAKQRNDFTRVMVVHDDNQVVGYYGLAPSAIDATGAPRRIRTERPPDPIPCLLIGQLAVDQRHHGRGVGSALVSDALRRCLAGAEIVGGRAVVVRAIDGEAEQYLAKLGLHSSSRRSVRVDAFDRRYPLALVGCALNAPKPDEKRLSQFHQWGVSSPSQ